MPQRPKPPTTTRLTHTPPTQIGLPLVVVTQNSKLAPAPFAGSGAGSRRNSGTGGSSASAGGVLKVMVAVEPHSRPLCHMICGQLLAVRSRGDKLLLAQVCGERCARGVRERCGSGVGEVWERLGCISLQQACVGGEEWDCTCAEHREQGGKGAGNACIILQHRYLSLMQ